MVDKNELIRLWDLAHEEAEANKKVVEDFFKSLTGKTIRVRSSIDGKDKSVNIEFIKEDGRSDFGSDLDVYLRAPYDYNTHSYGESELMLGHGSTGAESRRTAPFQVERAYMITKIWDREQELTDLLKNLPQTALQAAKDLQRQADREEYEEEVKARALARANAEAQIKAGFVFKETTRAGNPVEVEIVRVTPKRVTVAETYINPMSRPIYDNPDDFRNRKEIGRETGISKSTYTGYYDREQVINCLVNNFKISEQYNLKGQNYNGTEYEITNTVMY